MSWALEGGTALAELDLAPCQQQASAWNGKVQPLQPNRQLVAPPVGNAMTSDALWCRAMFSVRTQTTNQRREL
jgi:hypothetical protein